MKRKLMKKTAVCLLSSFLILTAAMAAGQESCPSIIYVSGMQAVYAADNEAGNPASKEKDLEADSSDGAETASDNSTAEDAADNRSTSENSTDGGTLSDNSSGSSEITNAPGTEVVRTAPLGSADSTGILAERVDGSAIVPGDRIIIVSQAIDVALSVNSSDLKIAPVFVTVMETSTRQVLTQIPEGTAVLEVESAGDSGIYLKCPQGYLTSSSDGSRLYFAESPEDCSIWQFRDDEFLFNPNAIFTSGNNTYRNFHLEFFSSGNYFSIYDKKTYDSESPYKLAFYRMGNSDPDDTLKEDTLYHLPVFQTSDTHGYLANTSGKDPLYLLACISDKVKDVRGYGTDARKDKAILLDGGDIYQGNTMSNLFDGESLSAAYQIMDYDAVTIGNHDFDWGIENTVDSDGTMMDHSMGEGSGENLIPVIVSNIYHDDKKIAFADDYIILQKTAVDADGNEIPVRNISTSPTPDRFIRRTPKIRKTPAREKPLTQQILRRIPQQILQITLPPAARTKRIRMGQNPSGRILLPGRNPAIPKTAAQAVKKALPQAAKPTTAKSRLPQKQLPAVKREMHLRPAILIISSSGAHWLASPLWDFP